MTSDVVEKEFSVKELGSAVPFPVSQLEGVPQREKKTGLTRSNQVTGLGSSFSCFSTRRSSSTREN